MEPTTLGIICGAAGTIAGTLGTVLVARTRRGEREDSALARVLERRDEDCRKLGERLDVARTGEQLAVAQAATFAAQVEALTQRFDDVERRLEESEAKNDACEQRSAKLTTRVHALEMKLRAEGFTPPNDTPAVPALVKTPGAYARHTGGGR